MSVRTHPTFNNWFYNHPKLVAGTAFSIVFCLSLLIAIKDHKIFKEQEIQKNEEILEKIENNIEQILRSSYVTTLSLVLTIQDNGRPKNFNEVASKLVASNKNIDGIELVPDGVVKYIYPYQENKEAIGLNILDYKYSQKEALKAIENRKMYFAGPLRLKQGGDAIIGRFPVFIENEFWGYSAVIIHLETFLQRSGIKDLADEGLNYRFAKINPNTCQREFFYNKNKGDFNLGKAEKIYIEDAEWEIYLLKETGYHAFITPFLFVIFGFLLASLSAFLVLLILNKPAQLQRYIQIQARKLLHSEIKFKTIFQKAGLGIVHIDENEKVLEVNPSFLAMTGYTFCEISNVRFSNLINVKEDSFQQVLQRKKFEADLSTKNKAKKNIRIINSTLNFNLKNTHILLIEDITKRKTAENKLKDLQARMQMAIRLSKLGYWEWEVKTDTIRWSARMYEVFDFDRNQELNSRLIINKIYPEDARKYKRQIKKIIETKQGATFETRIKNKEKGVLHILARVECEEDENGKLSKIRGILIDITDKKQAAIDLQHSYQMVVEQNERLLNFSYIVSHNLRSHSSNIQGIVEHLKHTESEEEMREMLGLLEEVAVSLNDTLGDLNEVVHVHKNTDGGVKNLNLNKFVRKVKSILKREIQIHQINFIEEIPPETTICFNPAYLESVLLNIISNAIKYRDTKKNSEIKLTFRENTTFKILEIKDNGIGIDLDANRNNIFGMYKTFTDFKNSRGIGLFVSNNQMQAMGGKIEVDSELSKGSTFTLYFKK